MPKDGRITHERILAAAKEEFLDKGFEDSSIRAIAKKAGVTSAALYRHFGSKHDIFAALVEPGLEAIDAWTTDHKARAYIDAENGRADQAATRSEVDMMREVVFPNRSMFKLLVNCSRGTAYEQFIHNLVERQQADLSQGIGWLKEKGFKVNDIGEGALHMMMSAYTTALFEPIAHDYPEEDTMRYYRTMKRFFLPGWRDLLGI